MKRNVPHGEPHLFTNLVGGRCGSAMSVARGWVEANRAKEGDEGFKQMKAWVEEQAGKRGGSYS